MIRRKSPKWKERKERKKMEKRIKEKINRTKHLQMVLLRKIRQKEKIKMV